MTTLFWWRRGDETTTGGGMVMHRELFYLGGVPSTAILSGLILPLKSVDYCRVRPGKGQWHPAP